MKVFNKKTRIISLLLAFIFLFQSCHVYHKVPISLDEAVAANKIMKVVTIDSKKYKFQKIQKSDSTYYGLLKTRGQDVKVPLVTAKIQSIHPVNKAASTALSVGAVIIPVGFVILLIGATSVADDTIIYPNSVPFPNMEPF
ncbi:hypothetical protein FEDK69T_26670 [Flavobacterium enshiense DK69]|uniref:Lipoprotein n=1 Tax=Flavobacterium enshiense DK69 TaxID=1107311 RepID=V6S347_9FLAO|nr:hypothetical protein [Flavobacterium enshiense]ESU21111.1 hypothetical protein FEDK69T_26670 [Flavobacterium enshiense DK69]KGO95253.1 hypothetical protein Q767_12390 [Flavobacterium enshiense DK69]